MGRPIKYETNAQRKLRTGNYGTRSLGLVKMTARYKGYCPKCHFTIWKNEVVLYNPDTRKVQHKNCVKAIADATPRVQQREWAKVNGKVSRSKFRKAADRSNLT